MDEEGQTRGRIRRRGRQAMRVMLGLAALAVVAGLGQLWVALSAERQAAEARERAAFLREAQGRLSELSLALAALGDAGPGQERLAALVWLGEAGAEIGRLAGEVPSAAVGGNARAAKLAEAAATFAALTDAARALAAAGEAAEGNGEAPRSGRTMGLVLAIAKADAQIDALAAAEAPGPLPALQRGGAGALAAALAGLGLGAGLLLLVRPLLHAAAARERDHARAAAELHTAALTDRLTGLPNRAAMELALDRLLAGPAGQGGQHGVLIVEVDRIDQLTGIFGHEAGEAVLRALALRLARDVGGEDLVARLGGSRIALAFAGVLDGDELVAVAERVRGLLLAPVDWQGSECRVGARIGAVLAEAGTTDAREALRDASLALARARRSGPQAPVALYAPALRLQAEEHRHIASDLRRALEQGEIRPAFQPQVCIETGRLLGIEALARWIPAQGPRRVPSEFLPLAAEIGLMTQIDDVMRRSSLRTFRNMRDAGLDPGHLGLNLTLSQLVEPGFAERLAFDIDAVDLAPSDVAIEILESIDLEAAGPGLVAVVERLSRAGHLIELDDFGTGHAGLSALRDLPVDRVKIDRSFVKGIEADPRLQHFTGALIALARRMGVGVLAEGVETEGERAWLAEGGCEAVQGYLVARPLPEDELVKWARAWVSGGAAARWDTTPRKDERQAGGRATAAG